MPAVLVSRTVVSWVRRSTSFVGVVLAAALVWDASASALPPGRAYEMVSPSAKNGGDIVGSPALTRASRDGKSVAFMSLSGFADVSGASLTFEYLGRRTSERWATHSLQPRQEPQTAELVTIFGYPHFRAMSEDLTIGIFRATSPLTNDPNVAHTSNLYRRTDLQTPGAGAYELITAASTPVPPAGTNPNNAGYRPVFADMSRDAAHVLFESRLKLTDDAPPQPGGCALVVTQCRPRVYASHGGDVRLVGVLPDGSAAASSAAGRGASGSLYTDGTMSDDGARAIFTAPVSQVGRGINGSQLYMRIDNSTTIRVSESERTDCAGDPTCGGDGVADPAPDPGGPQIPLYWAASADGEKVFFTTAEQLTDDDDNGATVDLYRYDASLPPEDPGNLTRLSIDEQPLDGGHVEAVIGVSDDGTYVYFAGVGQLVAGGSLEASSVGLFDIYVWHDGVIRNIGYFSPGDAQGSVGSSSFTVGIKSSRVTPDGTVMAFTSEIGEGLGNDHGSTCGNGAFESCSELYVYEADANGGQGRLICASCHPDGEAPTTDAGPALSVGSGGTSNTSHRGRYISDDGRYVFFTTGEPLVREDVNGRVNDVYVYDMETDTVQLLSAGKGREGSYFMDASASGNDAFFVTRDRLVGWDVDGNYDLYDARVGGGLPEPQAPPPPCRPGECRSAEAVPDFLTPSSMSLLGRQAGKVGVRSALRTSRLSRSQVARWARTGSIRLRVRGSHDGVVVAHVRGRIGGAVRTLARVSKRVVGGEASRLLLRLSVAARYALRSGDVLRVTLIAGYANQPEAKRQQAVLRPSALAGARNQEGLK